MAERDTLSVRKRELQELQALEKKALALGMTAQAAVFRKKIDEQFQPLMAELELIDNLKGIS